MIFRKRIVCVPGIWHSENTETGNTSLYDRTSTVAIFFLTRWALMERWQVCGIDARLEIQGISIFTVSLLNFTPIVSSFVTLKRDAIVASD